MVERAIDAFGTLDVLVNNAGITGRDAPLSGTTDEAWEKVMRLNLTATFYCCWAAIPRMRERRSGAVVNVASISGKEGNPNMIPYSVSKAGVICLTKALAKEVIHDGVRVNCVAPAVIENRRRLKHLRASVKNFQGCRGLSPSPKDPRHLKVVKMASGDRRNGFAKHISEEHTPVRFGSR